MNKEKYKIIRGVIICIILYHICAFFTYYGKTNEFYPIFWDSLHIEKLDLNKVSFENHVEKDGEKWIVSGNDAYIVYDTNINICRGIRVSFNNELSSSGTIQIFYSQDNEHFTQEKSVSTRFKKGEMLVEIPMECTEIKKIRLDVMMPVGTQFIVSGIEVDTLNVENIGVFTHYKNMLFNKYSVIYMVLIALGAICLIVSASDNTKVREKTILIGVWLMSLIMVYWDVWIGDYTLTPTNFMYAASPWSSLLVETKGPFLSDIADAHLPSVYNVYYGQGYFAWNNKVGFGVPVGYEIYLNPMNWFYFLPLKYAILLQSIFKFSVAYFSMCYMLKRMRLKISAVALGGVSYALSSAMVMWHFWPHTSVMMFAPLFLALGNKLIKTKNIREAFLMALVVFGMLIAEMPTYAAYVVYLMGFYVLFITIRTYGKDYKNIINVFLKFGISIILGVIAAMPYLRGLLHSVVDNGYADSRVHLGRNALTLESLGTLVVPYEDYGGHSNEVVLYVGLFSLLLILFSGIRIREKKEKHIIFWLSAFLVVLVLVYTHLLDFVYVMLPGINTSSKTRLIAVVALLAVILSAINIDDISRNPEEYKKHKTRYCLYAMAFLFILWTIWKFGEDKTWAINAIIAIECIVIALEMIIGTNSKQYRILSQIIAIGITILNMGSYARQYLPLIEREADIIPEVTDSVKYLQDNLEDARVYQISGWNFFPNTNVYYGINSITSHAFSNTNEDIQAYLLSIDDSCYASRTAVHGSKVDSYALLKYAGVKYILKNSNDLNVTLNKAENVYTGDDGMDIYELDAYNERFFLSENVVKSSSEHEILAQMKAEYKKNRVYVMEEAVESRYSQNPLNISERIHVVQDEMDYIKLEVSSNENRILVFNEYYDENWKVLVDNEEIPIFKANYLFNAVDIEPGEHIVEFRYDVSKTNNLVIIASIDIFMIILALFICNIRDKRLNCRKEEHL